MTNPGFNAFGSAPMPYDQQTANRQALVNAMMQQAGNGSPALSPWQGIQRGTAGIAAGLMSDPNWQLGSLFKGPTPAAVPTSSPLAPPMNPASMY